MEEQAEVEMAQLTRRRHKAADRFEQASLPRSAPDTACYAGSLFSTTGSAAVPSGIKTLL